jgi:hypothetical protein
MGATMGTRTSEGIAQLSSGNTAEGRATLLQALAAGEPAAPIWYALSLAADSPDECCDCLRKALEADPFHDLARWELARLASAHSRPNGLMSLYGRALELLRRVGRTVAGSHRPPARRRRGAR